MSGGWKKMKNLFWVSDGSEPAPTASEEDGDLDPEILRDRYAVPEGDTSGPHGPVSERLEALAREVTVRMPEGQATPDAKTADLGAPIDFQTLYDQAEVPNTDEVEALERFLDGLDDSLPQASKLSAAKAFLKAIGKSTDDVLVDAARKIQVVRALRSAKEKDTNALLEAEQKKIDAFERQIEKLRVGMEQSRMTLEALKKQCELEEGRLQTARVFFGHMQEVK